MITKTSLSGFSILVINVYIPVPQDEALSVCYDVSYRIHVLLNEGRRNLIVCGDFNVAGAKFLVNWLLSHGFLLASDSSLPTHSRGNILDFICTTGQIE